MMKALGYHSKEKFGSQLLESENSRDIGEQKG